MDSARQVIRWSMPGWLFLFWLAVFQIIQNVYVFGSVAAAMRQSALSQLTTGSAAVIIGAGVPLGFLIYQLYYYTHDHLMPLSLAPADRGGDILRSLPSIPEELKAYEPELDIEEMCEEVNVRLLSPVVGGLRRLKSDFRDEKGRKRYLRNRLVNFEVVRFYFAVISTELRDDSFRQEYRNLSDIYNAIGASSTALVCSFALYLFYNLLSSSHRADLLGWPLAVNASAFTATLAVVQYQWNRTGAACQSILSHATRWYALEKRAEAESNFRLRRDGKRLPARAAP